MDKTEQTIEAAEEIILLLTQQDDLYRQLHELACQQTVLVDGKNPEMLLKVLASRQRLINKLTAIDQKLKPIRNNWDELFLSLNPQQKRQVQQLVDSVKQTLGDIIQRDKCDTEKLHACKDQVASQIRNVNTGRQMNNIYAQGSTNVTRSRYLDLQSE
ncbi:MAG: hypothetical protein JEZ07_07520 [Phycisphaerae bacterium]|nr:hypothetical protein [Phycisphaerae bacterium]